MQDQERALAELTMAELTKAARTRAHLSMRGLARRSGLSAAQISRIEAGEVERPVAETLVKLAKALDRDAQLLLVFGGHIRGARARQLLRQAIEALPEPGRAEQADALARLEAEDEHEQRLREELAEAERALATAQRAAGEQVAAEPLRETHERLREVGLLAQRRAVEVAERRRQFERLDHAPSEEVCALAGRLFLHTAAGGDHLEAWRQFSGQITPDDPELRQLLQAWRQLEHERRKRVLEFSQDQVALSLLWVEKAILGSVQGPEETFETVRNGGYSPSGEEAVGEVEAGGGEAYGGSEEPTRWKGMKDPPPVEGEPFEGGSATRRKSTRD
jgi:transcriptional regulator with XRE-family HTH domain